MNLGNLLHNKRSEWIYCPVCGSKTRDKTGLANGVARQRGIFLVLYA
ncbi:hypothetical protein D5272_03820 [bacterium D16-76]|nr:hypothetical protein [bacterium D16-76]